MRDGATGNTALAVFAKLTALGHPARYFNQKRAGLKLSNKGLDIVMHMTHIKNSSLKSTNYHVCRGTRWQMAVSGFSLSRILYCGTGLRKTRCGLFLCSHRQTPEYGKDVIAFPVSGLPGGTCKNYRSGSYRAYRRMMDGGGDVRLFSSVVTSCGETSKEGATDSGPNNDNPGY